MLLANIGQRLAHKPSEWMSWWWQIKWEDFIDVYPQLSEDNPLWQREDSHLENIRLCGLAPNELQAEIANYWQKPFWRRWVLSIFTNIDSKIVIWSYYNRCLSFRIIHRENPALDQHLTLYDPEERLLNQFLYKLKQDTDALENSLEKHAGHTQWVEKNLGGLLTKHEKKRQRYFLKLLNQYLSDLPLGSDHEAIREKLEKEYQKLEKILRNYVENSYQTNMRQPEPNLPIQENPHRELVYVGPSEVIQNQGYAYDENDDVDMDSINEWLALKRDSIKELLKEEPCPYDAIHTLLKKSLRSLQTYIESQMGCYERSIKDVIYKREHYKGAIEWSEYLQQRLIHFFRSSSLLFHPDKSHGNEHLKLIKTELFKEFQYFAENSLERLTTGLKALSRCIPKWEADLEKMLEEAEREHQEFKARMDQIFAEIRTNNAEIRANCAEMRESNAEMRESNAEMWKKQTQMEEQLNALMRQMGMHSSHPEEQEPFLEFASPRP